YAEPFSKGIDRFFPGVLQVFPLRPQRRLWLGSEFEGHPLHVHIFSPDGFLQRNLRDETEGSHVVRVNANLQRHEKRLPPFKAGEKNPCCGGEGGAAIPSADRKVL